MRSGKPTGNKKRLKLIDAIKLSRHHLFVVEFTEYEEIL
jgi:hypothetical protein